MNLELIGVVIAAVCALAAYLPFVFGTGKRIREIASWRTRVDDTLDALRRERRAGDDELCRRLDKIDRALEARDHRDGETAAALRGLAEMAGRAVGRTERD